MYMADRSEEYMLIGVTGILLIGVIGAYVNRSEGYILL